MDDVLYEAARNMIVHGPYGDDYASNFAFNLTAVVLGGGALVGDIVGSALQNSEYGAAIRDHTPDYRNNDRLAAITGREDSYLARAGFGGIIGAWNGAWMDYISNSADPSMFNNTTTSAAAAGGAVGLLLEKTGRDAIVKAGRILDPEYDDR